MIMIIYTGHYRPIQKKQKQRRNDQIHDATCCEQFGNSEALPRVCIQQSKVALAQAMHGEANGFQIKQ